MNKETILYVDDEEINLLLFKANFEEEYNIVVATSGQSGLEILKNNTDINIIVSDIKMPGMSGFEFIQKVKSQYPEKVCIILSAFSRYDFSHNSDIEKNIYRYLNKPLQRDEMNRTIIDAIDSYTS